MRCAAEGNIKKKLNKPLRRVGNAAVPTQNSFAVNHFMGRLATLSTQPTVNNFKFTETSKQNERER